MKFLYLKGVEILGPLQAEEIVKADCFSDDLLVCPEDKAEQGAAWKPASCYPEFQASLQKEIFPIKETDSTIDLVDSGVPSTDYGRQKDEEIFQSLPPLEDTDNESSTVNTESQEISFNEVMNQLSNSDESKDSEEEVDDVKDHTFNIAHKEDNLLEDLPAHSLIGTEKDSLNTQDYGNGEDLTKSRRIKNVDENKSDGDQNNNDQEGKKELMDISNNKIISSSDGRVKKRRSNDLLFIISFLVLMVVAIALCMAFWNVMNENADDNSKETNAVEVQDDNNVFEENTDDITPEVEEEKLPSSEVVAPEELLQSESVNTEEQVINIVKDTKLTNKGKTVGEYLQNIYGNEYKSTWSAKPFTDNVYIVEFFASKIRNEPFVYLFRVDVDQKKITGALNNITLDLLA
ncbi:MAG: hypothetical protein J5594_03055 [Elusimicrobiaceae bacterium]|nr:hypothetical protein [Elusimicrobiaceae bacterium]